ncbi:unnamed protein product [Cylicocyclus nassatus]|uniref:Uncharacterized protein n=1 Tax=Cylicocyclus nassatus TaxID=53992 RepID=A0AA36GSU4_CYLNA|nr:unnamed protein product [Cylicocyclus nassatus]
MTIWRTKTRRGEPVRKSESSLQHRGQERSRSRSLSSSPLREPGVTLEKIVSNNYAAAAAVAQMVRAHGIYRDVLEEHLMTRNIGQHRSVAPSATAQKVVQQAVAAAPPPSEAKAKPPQAEPQLTTSNPQQSSSQQ